MRAQFEFGQTEIEVQDGQPGVVVEVRLPGYRVPLAASSSEPEQPQSFDESKRFYLGLSKSQARSVASAIMGAAAAL